jgi:predicted permease
MAAAVATWRSSYTRNDGAPEEVVEAQVTPKIFRTLGARVVLGRDFIDSDGLPEPEDPSGVLESAKRLPTYAIASQEFFQRRFGGNPAFLGQPIVKNGPILIGVMERGVELLFRPDKEVEPRPDLWLAWRLHYSEKGRSSHYLRVIARLRPGVTLERAQSEADAVAGEIGAIDSAYRGAGLAIHLQPMQPFLVAYVRPAILALMGAVIFLLLIACSNVTNLFLVRSSLRSRDLAIRTAIGASWWRLARQMLAEALFVSALGSAMGFGLAWAGVRQLLAVAPPNLPRRVRIDLAVLAFGIGAGLFASVLFTLAPAVRVARPDVAEVLRGGSRTGGLNGGLFIRNFVVVAEVALCFVLLVGSGLMFRSFLALRGIRPGYDPHNLLTFRIMGGNPRAPPKSVPPWCADADCAVRNSRGAERHSGHHPATHRIVPSRSLGHGRSPE